MDYVFSPVSADRVVLESTLKFASVINDNLISVGRSNIKGLYLIWNMVDGREKNELYEVYETIIGELGLQILKTLSLIQNDSGVNLLLAINPFSVPLFFRQTRTY